MLYCFRRRAASAYIFGNDDQRTTTLSLAVKPNVSTVSDTAFLSTMQKLNDKLSYPCLEDEVSDDDQGRLGFEVSTLCQASGLRLSSPVLRQSGNCEGKER